MFKKSLVYSALLAVVGAVFLILPVSADSPPLGDVVGRLTDELGQPIEGAEIAIPRLFDYESGAYDVTDSNGEFLLEDVCVVHDRDLEVKYKEDIEGGFNEYALVQTVHFSSDVEYVYPTLYIHSTALVLDGEIVAVDPTSSVNYNFSYTNPDPSKEISVWGFEAYEVMFSLQEKLSFNDISFSPQQNCSVLGPSHLQCQEYSLIDFEKFEVNMNISANELAEPSSCTLRSTAHWAWDNDREIYDVTFVREISVVEPQPPVANDDTVETPYMTPVVVNVLANDSDPDEDLDASSVNVVAGPAHGSVSVNSVTGEVTYDPGSFIGTDTFEYEVCDSMGLCDSASVTVTVTPPPEPEETRRLIINVQGNGLGSVSVDGEGVNEVCVRDSRPRKEKKVCKYQVAKGTTVTLKAEPREGYYFAGWRGACKKAGNNEECTITLDKNRTVVAKFKRNPRLKLVLKKEDGKVKVRYDGEFQLCSKDGGKKEVCKYSFEPGTRVTLIAYPEKGYKTIWSGGGCTNKCKCKCNNICTFTMDKDRRVTVKFVKR